MLSLYERAPDGRGGGLLRPDGPDLAAPHATARAGRPQRRPERLRATFNRRHGTRYGFGAYDVHADRLRLQAAPSARRRRHARLPAHDPLAATRAGCASTGSRTASRPTGPPTSASSPPSNNVELVPIPTYASYLNRIEAHFRPINEFVVSNADYLDWDAFAHALARHIQHRNGPDRDRRIAALERKLTIAA